MILVIKLFAHSPCDLRRCKELSIIGGLLFSMHLLDQFYEPSLEQGVVVVRHNQISNPVQSLLSQLLALELEIAHVMVSEKLHEIFLDSSASGHYARDHAVLAQVPNVLSHSAGCHIGSVPQKYSAPSSTSRCWVFELLCLVVSDRLIR